MKLTFLAYTAIIFFVSIQAASVVPGRAIISEGIRAKELVIQGANYSIGEDVPPFQDEKSADTSSEGLIAFNLWSSQCSLGNAVVRESIISEQLNLNVLQGPINLEFPEKSGQIHLVGELKSKSESSQPHLSVSLLETSTLQVEGVKQWVLLETETFSFTYNQNNSTLLQDDWKVIKLDSGDASKLQPNSLEMALGTLKEKVVKQFIDLPEHNHIKIEGNFFFISPFWRGESAQIKINGKIVWLDSHEWVDDSKLSIADACQIPPTRFNEFIWVQPFSVVTKSSTESFTIELGLTKSIPAILECQDISQKLLDIPLFGFDDFSLYVK